MEVDGFTSSQQGAARAESEALIKKYKSFTTLLVSKLCFLTASACYLTGAVLDFMENAKPVHEEGASLSWVLLIIGASSFIVVVMLDYWNHYYDRLQLFLTMAGIFATISAATSTNIDLTTSVIWNLVASHVYLVYWEFQLLCWIYRDGHHNDYWDSFFWWE